jgi:hypothetical protein
MFSFISVALLTITLCLSQVEASHAAIIFSEDFDAVQDGWNCSEGTPQGWTSKMACYSGTVDGVTHYGGEITKGGVTGNSLKIWKAGQYWTGFAGGLNVDVTAQQLREIYTRWYMKIPSQFSTSGTMTYLKLWRYNLSNNSTIYLNFNGPSFAQSSIEVYATSSDKGWSCLLSSINIPKDDQWHCYELRLKLSSSGMADGIVAFWLDGKSIRSFPLNFGVTNDTYIKDSSVGLGNTGASSYQPGWQAVEFDNYVLSTQYIGPLGTGVQAPSGLRLTGIEQ